MPSKTFSNSKEQLHPHYSSTYRIIDKKCNVGVVKEQVGVAFTYLAWFLVS